MLAIRRRHERLPDEVGLAEHAVQVQVEAGQQVARAKAEARREHARVAVRVDDGEVRRVPVGHEPGVERREQRRRAPADRTARASPDAREALTRQDAPPREGDLDRVATTGCVRLEVAAGEHAAALADERQHSRAIVPP